MRRGVTLTSSTNASYVSFAEDVAPHRIKMVEDEARCHPHLISTFGDHNLISSGNKRLFNSRYRCEYSEQKGVSLQEENPD